MIQCIFCVKEVYSLSTLKEDIKLTLVQTFMSHILILLKRKVLVNILQLIYCRGRKNTCRKTLFEYCSVYFTIVSWQFWILN